MSWLDKLFTTGYKTVQLNGVPYAQEPVLNFGPDFSTTDDSTNTRTTVKLANPTRWVTITDSTSTGTVNDYPYASKPPWLRFTNATGPTINGLAAGNDDDEIMITAVGNTTTIANQAVGSLAANRIITGTGANVTLSTDQTARLIYDATTARWRIDGVSTGGGGGGTPGGSNTQLQFNNSGAFGGAANLTYTAGGALAVSASGFVTFGATPSASGLIRTTNATQVFITMASGANDLGIISTNGTSVYIGSDSALSAASQVSAISMYPTAGGAIAMGLGGSTWLYLPNGSAAIEAWKPLMGSGSGSSPYAVHGEAISAMADATYTIPSSEYKYSVIKFTQAMTAGRQANLPGVGTDGPGAYWKYIRNLTTGGFALTIGATSGGAGTVVIANGKGAFVLIDNTNGAVRMTPDT